MTSSDDRRQSLLFEIFGVACALFLTFAAVADITGGEADVRLEYGALIGSGAMCSLVALRLWRRGPRWMGGLSLAVILACAAVAPSLAAVPASRLSRWIFSGALLWFAVVNCVLVAKFSANQRG